MRSIHKRARSETERAPHERSWTEVALGPPRSTAIAEAIGDGARIRCRRDPELELEQVRVRPRARRVCARARPGELRAFPRRLWLHPVDDCRRWRAARRAARGKRPLAPGHAHDRATG